MRPRLHWPNPDEWEAAGPLVQTDHALLESLIQIRLYFGFDSAFDLGHPREPTRRVVAESELEPVEQAVDWRTTA